MAGRISHAALTHFGKLYDFGAKLNEPLRAEYDALIKDLRLILEGQGPGPWTQEKRVSHGEKISQGWQEKRARQRFILAAGDTWFYLDSWEAACVAWNGVLESSLRITFSKARSSVISGFCSSLERDAVLARLPLTFPYLTLADFKAALASGETTVQEWTRLKEPAKKLRPSSDPDSESYRPPVRVRKEQ